ncbi:MAG TPA: magnesium chelatase subunit D [Rubrivivax sp.]|nr:magnesium chelatase subunit D [Rubrivivax sp.]
MSEAPAADAAWTDAAWAAAMFAIDPHGLGGIALRAGAGPVRDAWSLRQRALLPQGTPWRRLPTHITDDRLLGGLDLTATLQAGRPVAQRGLLAESHGGVVVIAMAERLGAATAARLASALDRGDIGFERDGIGQRWPSRIGVVAFDEGRDDDPVLPAALADRLAFHCDLTAVGWGGISEAWVSAAEVMAARAGLGAVTLPEPIALALCATALRMGVDSMRASLLVMRAACAAAALHGRTEVDEDDARLAARLVLAPRATLAPPPEARSDAPASEPAPPPQPPPDAPPPDPPPPHTQAADSPPPPEASPADAPPAPASDAAAQRNPEDAAQALEDRLVGATQAALPAGLLAALLNGEAARGAGRIGALSASKRGGRPMGARAGEPRGGARLNLIETLRAAAPWQRLRAAAAAPGAQQVHVRASDLRVARLQQRAATATLFVIDASGSSALHRLAEAKGAVNLLLAECYVRRDQVGVIAFRGRSAEVLLPPTRSLVRAKRSLAALPGGGGTPLAAGLQAALAMAAQVRRAGAVPIVVLLTDGRANVALDGASGRARAEADALQMARHMRAARLNTLLVDTSPQASPNALRLAQAMAAPYRVLPHAGAVELVAAVSALPRQAL